MKLAVRRACGGSSLVVLSLFALVAGAGAQSTSSTAAHVYIQTQGSAGPVYGFSSSSSGQLSTISGSPFKPAGQIIGSTSTKFLTMGETLLHSYKVSSTGAIESQASQIPFLNYAGGNCGSAKNGVANAVLDHTGQYIYAVLQNGGTGECAAYQTYKINSDDSFTFVGDSNVSLESGGGVDAPSILGSETFAYADSFYSHQSNLIGFQRESSGELSYLYPLNLTVAGGVDYTPNYPDASPVAAGNYVVVQMYPNDSNPPQFGVFSADSQGNLTTTNTSANMPTSQLIGPATTFSPSGNFLVAYSTYTSGEGIEIYKFNGASPLTLYQTVLKGTPIDQVKWDNSNHMYAISRTGNKLYVFTVTATGVTEVSSKTISSPLNMIVVSTASAPSATTQYETSLYGGKNYSVEGHVTVDTAGNTTVSVTGQAAKTTYKLQFCPEYNEGLNAKTPSCFDVTTVTTDSSGSGTGTAKFPKSGDWAGEFATYITGEADALQSDLAAGVSNEAFMATLLPETKTNNGAIAATNGMQDPLNSGSVSYANGALQFTVTGASANTSYQAIQTYSTALYSSNSYNIGSFMTDALGNGSTVVSFNNESPGGDIFNVEGGSGAGYIGGFSIP